MTSHNTKPPKVETAMPSKPRKATEKDLHWCTLTLARTSEKLLISSIHAINVIETLPENKGSIVHIGTTGFHVSEKPSEIMKKILDEYGPMYD